MAINYLPNDPLSVQDSPMRRASPRADRPSNRAGFFYNGAVAEDRYDIGTPGFLFWQCSEAALAAMETWEKLDGSLTSWANNRSRLNLRQDAGVDLNAYYDRTSLSFFHWRTGSKTTWSGASTDVVAHETGHALLDAVRPDLWNSFYTEVNAFHEAFGDCVALLTALDDRRQRERLLSVSPWLWTGNFLEATTEDLADGVRRHLGAQHSAAEPRHALNWFNWQLPETLPMDGPPNRLTSEIHSFGRVFSGCFYDTIGLIFANQSSHTQHSLWTAAETAGRILLAAVRSAPETPRFFQSVGRAMILADEQLSQGDNHLAIRDAFGFHGIALGSSAMLAPTTALAGAAPAVSGGARAVTALSAATRRDLGKRIGARKGARMAVRALKLAGQRVTEVIHEREISLAGLDSRLKGVICRAAEPVLIGGSGKRAAVLGRLPQAQATADEVNVFVRSLLEHDRVDFAPRGKRRRAATTEQTCGRPTHTVAKSGKHRILKRVRMACPG